MRIREVMTTSPRWCLLTDSASKVAGIMKDINAGIIPVVENEQGRRLIGVVTDRDLCLEVSAESRDPAAVPVKDCMTRTLICCAPEDDVGRAIELMRDNQIRRIPIVDQQGTLQGIVSMADLLHRADMPSGPIHETIKKVSEPSELSSKPRSQQLRKSA
jgi:CBS domain-containing protein